MVVKIVDTKDTEIKSRITSKGSTGTGESGVSIKDSSGKTIVTAKKGSSSTTVQPSTTGVYDSAGRIKTSAIQNDPNIKGDYVYIQKGNSKILKSYWTDDAQNYLKQKYAEQENKKKQASDRLKQLEAERIAAKALAAELNRQAELKRQQQIKQTPVYTPVIKTVPTPVNPSYQAEYMNNEAAKIEQARLNEAAKNLKPSTISSLKGGSTVSKGNETKTTMVKEKVEKAIDLSKNYMQLGAAEKTVSKIETYVVSKADAGIKAIEENKTLKTIDTTAQKIATPLKKVSPIPVITPSQALKGGVGVVEGAALMPTSTIRLGVGLVTNPVKTVEDTVKGTIEQAKTQPERLAGNIIGGAIAGGAVIKGGKVIKQNVPSISKAPQDIYIKTKVSSTPEIKTPEPKPIKQAEYIASGIGKDNFKITEIQSQVTKAPTPKKTIDVLTGKTEKGVTDVYIKVDKNTAKNVAGKYSGELKNVKINDDIHAMVFEPKAEIVNKPYVPKSETPKLTTKPKRTAIGTSSGVSKSKPINVKNPYRLETKLTLQETKLTISDRPNVKLLPESTQTIEVKAKVVTEPKRLKSGEVKIWESESGSLLMKDKKKTLTINELGWTKEKVMFAPEKAPLTTVKKAPLQFKEPIKSFGFEDEFKRLYNTPEPKKAITLETRPTTTKAPFMFTVPVTTPIATGTKPTDYTEYKGMSSISEVPQIRIDDISRAGSKDRTAPFNTSSPTSDKKNSPLYSLDIKPISQPSTKPFTIPTTLPDTAPQTKPVTKPQTRPYTKPVTQPVTKPLPKPVIKPVATPEITYTKPKATTVTGDSIPPTKPPRNRFKYYPSEVPPIISDKKDKSSAMKAPKFKWKYGRIKNVYGNPLEVKIRK